MARVRLERRAIYVVYRDGWPVAVGTLDELASRLGRTKSSLAATATLTRKGKRNPDFGVFKVEG